MNKTLKWIIVLAVAVGIGSLFAVGANGAGLFGSLSGTGTVKTKAVVSLSSSVLAWGDISQGTSKDITIVATNNGETETGTLTIVTTALPTGLSLTWDTTDTITPGEAQSIKFTLTATESAQAGAFTHTVTID